MGLRRYFTASLASTSKKGIRSLLLPTWIKVAAILVGVVVLVALFASSRLTAISSKAQMDALAETLRQLANSEAARISGQLADEVGGLEAFAQTGAVREGLLQSQEAAAPGTSEIVFQANPAAATALEEWRQTHSEFVSVALLNGEGILLAISPMPQALPAAGREQWSWFNQSVGTGETVIEETRASGELTDASGIRIAIPLQEDDAPIGVLYAVIDPLALAYRAQADTDLHVNVFKRDSGGIIIPAIDPARGDAYPDTLFYLLAPRTKSELSGTAYYRSPTGRREYNQVYAFTVLESLQIDGDTKTNLGWVVVAQRTGDNIIDTVGATNSALALVMWTGAGFILLSILTAVFLFNRPLLNLTHIAEHIIEQDDLKQPVPPYSRGEAKILANTIRRLAGRLHHQNTYLNVAVKVSQESLHLGLQAILDRSVQMMCEQMGYSWVGIYGSETGKLRASVLAATGNRTGEASLKTGDVVIAGDLTLAGRALSSQIEQRDPGVDAATFAGAKASPDQVVIPLAGKIPGALHVIANKANVFAEGDLEILRLIANQIGFILENRYLLTETEMAKEDAEKANQVKSQFLASMSHELRTPLNAILNFSKFLSSGMLGEINSEQKDVAEKISASGRHLLNLINDVLDISKIESGSLRLFVEDDVDLNEAAQHVADAARALLVNKPVNLALDIERNLPEMVGDKRRITQIMLNLVSNACKFTDTGSVSISLHQQDATVEFAVRDTGPGIAPEDYETIFESFRQTETGLRQGEGTGLGLPIARRLAEAHGGRLWLESQPGKGTTFFLNLPIRSEDLLALIDKGD